MDNETLFAKIKEITEIQAISGREQSMIDYMEKKITPYVDEIIRDGLGGLFGVKRSQNPHAKTVMVASHMDEVGFLVSQILDNGMIKAVPIGGWNVNVVSSQRFTLQTKQGDYPIITSSVSPHLLRGTNGQGQLELADILFDAGFASKDEALNYGVKPGDAIVPKTDTVLTANGERVISKAWDNRYGCLLILELAKALQNVELDYHLVMGANVQEEVGLRGATVAANKIKPDMFFAVDCSAADDLYGKQGTFGHLGEGFLMRVQDPRMITLPRMQEFLEDVANENEIPYQYFVSKGGTDAGAVHLANVGIPSAVIGVCARYIHTHQTLFSLNDYKSAEKMLKRTLTTLSSDRVQQIIYGG